MKRQVKSELNEVKSLNTKKQMVKALDKMKAESKIEGFGVFKDGINIYHNGLVVFEINIWG